MTSSAGPPPLLPVAPAEEATRPPPPLVPPRRPGAAAATNDVSRCCPKRACCCCLAAAAPPPGVFRAVAGAPLCGAFSHCCEGGTTFAPVPTRGDSLSPAEPTLPCSPLLAFLFPAAAAPWSLDSRVCGDTTALPAPPSTPPAPEDSRDGLTTGMDSDRIASISRSSAAKVSGKGVRPAPPPARAPPPAGCPPRGAD